MKMPKSLPMILPCPWCGRRAGHDARSDSAGPTLEADGYMEDGSREYSVVCANCGATGGSHGLTTEGGVIRAWNRVAGAWWASHAAAKIGRES